MGAAGGEGDDARVAHVVAVADVEHPQAAEVGRHGAEGGVLQRARVVQAQDLEAGQGPRQALVQPGLHPCAAREGEDWGQGGRG